MRPVKLRFAAEAREHIAAIYNYIRDRNPVAATQVVARIVELPNSWLNFRAWGMSVVYRVPMNGSCVACPNIIVYQTGATDPDEVLVLGVFHAAQDRERE